MIEAGTVAPDFRVGDRSLYEVLGDGAVVVFFFPKAFTPGCTKEANGFRREYEKLKLSGCEVVGVSRDDQATNDRFRESLGLPYPLVGDPGGTITSAYKVDWPLIGRAKRTTFLIGRDRHVRLAFHDEFKMDAHSNQACTAVTKV
jgi:thioredoxin-dependent peroxiredoxin